MESIVTVVELSRNWGETILFEKVSFDILKGSKVALVAKNGTGKTTLLDTIAGLQSPDHGNVELLKDTVLGYLPQEPKFDETLTVLDTVYHSSSNLLNVIRAYEEALLDTDKNRLQMAMEAMERQNAWTYENTVKEILFKLNITNLGQIVSELSGGQKKRLALASILIDEPDMLILDEPTNHLDLSMIEWLEGYLSKSEITLFMVTHDRYFLDRICSEILELDNGNIYRYAGNYSYFLEKRDDRINNMLAERERARNLMKKEQEWMRRMPKARSTKAKYRVDAFYDLKDKASVNISEKEVNIKMGTSRLGGKILSFKNLKKSYDDLVLLDGFTYKFSKGEKLGIIGGNGVGKSTFLNIITEQAKPDSGEIEKGETVVYGYFHQEGMKLDEGKKVLEVITDISESIVLGKNHTVSSLQFLNLFLFPPAMHNVLVSKLSGGEKRRLYLMTILMLNPNFLILDEPTNDLDIQTLNVLEDYLANFQGCLIIVSHDRFFMDKIVEHLFVFEGGGVIKDFAGNYSLYRDYLNQVEKEEKKIQKAEAPKIERPKQEKKIKLSYKEKLEYAALPTEIEGLEKEKNDLEAKLGLGTLSQEELMAFSNRIAEIMDALDEKEMRWLELSEKDDN